MLENGLLDEARAMQGKCQKTCAQAIGHKELARYLTAKLLLKNVHKSLRRKVADMQKGRLHGLKDGRALFLFLWIS